MNLQPPKSDVFSSPELTGAWISNQERFMQLERRNPNGVTERAVINYSRLSQ